MTTILGGDVEARAGRLIRRRAHRLIGDTGDFDALLDRVGEAHVVLIGTASHGTHEFYRIRAEITKRLIREKGFTGVAVDADWPAAHRVNRFVRGIEEDAGANDALRDLAHFPAWMWRNADVLDFVGWLRAHNDMLPSEQRVGFYGLDQYSLHASIAAVLQYLRRTDPGAARRSQALYACFDHFGAVPQDGGHSTALGLTPSREQEIVDRLVEQFRASGEQARHHGADTHDGMFAGERSARVVRDAEQYYRALVRGGPAAWNLRGGHMADTLDALRADLSTSTLTPKFVVWAHNAHLGDAQWTEMSSMGELNMGQLVRAKLADDAVLVGFTTYAGTVTAANDWDAPPERKIIRPALPGSYECLFHSTGLRNFLLIPRLDDPADDELILALDQPMLERSIGVVYRQGTERFSHYCLARLARQFDAVFHYDVTRSVEPLDRPHGWEQRETRDTVPNPR